jgi:nucleoside-diphosphate-sugar epimerase
MSKTALVLGAGGFIGGHLVKRLKREGFFVVGADLRRVQDWWQSGADVSFGDCDLREPREAARVLEHPYDAVYQLAADMGGMGFISSSEIECLTNNARINMNCSSAAASAGVKRYLFSSSVCVYRDVSPLGPGAPSLTEADAYPAGPDNEYGWEKLYSERVAQAFARRHPAMRVRIARFENCFGPHGSWTGGREKAPAALARKVAEAPEGGSVEVWGDGSATRSFIYVDDLVDGIRALTESDEARPTNIGTEEIVTVRELAEDMIRISGKKLSIAYDPTKPVGVQGRNFSHARMRALGWEPKISLHEGLRRTYEWIGGQVAKAGGPREAA